MARMASTLCGNECESEVHVLWECPACKDTRDAFIVKRRNLLGESFKDFESMGIVETLFVLSCEHWENFESLLAVVKEYISNLGEVRKVWSSRLEGCHCG